MQRRRNTGRHIYRPNLISALADLITGFRPDNKMPVTGHCHHGINWQRHDFPCLCDDTHERGIVFWIFKNRQPNHRSVENVEHVTCRTTTLLAVSQQTC
jgi:hypothetical protein